MQANNRLLLGVQIVASYLQQLHPGSSVAHLSEGSNLVRASLVNEQNETLVNIVGVGLEPTKAMISLFQHDTSLGQAIVNYESDLLMDNVNFPTSVDEFLESKKDQVFRTLNAKFRLLPSQQPRRPSYSLRTTHHGDQVPPASIGIPSVVSQGVHRRPSDMPDFEDEYQVREGRGMLSTPQRPLQGYGDSDIYPLGARNPLMSDPLAAPPPGGMVLDPTQDSARRRQMQDSRTRGPGFMPGARWDDPFGPPGPGNGSGLGNFGSGGLGPGGFI